jgi:D-lactate dehydrogenase
MAGDRGLLIPELTKLATKAESYEIMEINADGYYSSNIPCEIGMSNSTGKQYLSIAYLIRDVIKLNE